MPGDLPSTQFRRFRDLSVILAETIHRDGDRILLDLLKNRTRENSERRTRLPLARAIVNKVRGVASQVREQGIKQIGKGSLVALEQSTWEGWKAARKLPATLKKTGLMLGALTSASYLSGIAMGFQAPAIDIRLSRKGQDDSGIVVHSAPLFSLEVTVEWLNAILKSALLHPQLAPEDRAGIAQLEAVVAQLSRGVAAGAAARAKTGSRDPGLPAGEGEEVEVKLDDQVFAMAGSFFSFLSDFSRR